MHMRHPEKSFERDPEGADRKDPISWMVREMSTNVIELLKEAGYAKEAEGIDQAAVAQGMKEVEQAFRMPQPRYTGQWSLPINWD